MTCGGGETTGVCGIEPKWTPVTSPTTSDLIGLWGSSANDVWAVGLGGTILRWQGSSWTKVTSPVTESLYDVWGSSANDVWAVGDFGTVLHWPAAP